MIRMHKTEYDKRQRRMMRGRERVIYETVRRLEKLRKIGKQGREKR